MYYATGEEKTKEDYEVLLQELTAYLELENDYEDYFYLINDIKEIRNLLLNWGLYNKNKKTQTIKPKYNRYERKKLTQQKLKKLSQLWWTVYYNENEDRYIKIYYSGRRNYAKYCSNKKVRNTNKFSLKGGGYRKVFDYWWCVF